MFPNEIFVLAGLSQTSGCAFVRSERHPRVDDGIGQHLTLFLNGFDVDRQIALALTRNNGSRPGLLAMMGPAPWMFPLITNS